MFRKFAVLLFVCFCSIVFVSLSANSSARLKQKNGTTVKASPTPKQKANKPQKRQTQRKSVYPHITPPTMYVTLSTSTIYLPCDDKNPSISPCGNNSILNVHTAASYREPLFYNYNVTVGKIVGSGANVVWDLSGVAEGKYKITAQVDDGKGLITTQEKEIEVVKCQCESTEALLNSVDNANNPNKFTFGISISPTSIRRRNIPPPPNRPPTLQSSLSSSIVYLPCDKKPETQTSNEKSLIDVAGDMYDSDGDKLIYTYTVTGGKIIGTGDKVQWDLSGVKEGKYQIIIQVDDGRGAVVEEVKEIEVMKQNCVSTLLELETVNSDNTQSENSPTSNFSSNEDNPHGFIIALSLGRRNPRELVYMPPNSSPVLQPIFLPSFVYLPCDIKENLSLYSNVIYSVDIFPDAFDPDGDTMLYTYDVSDGKIIGTGRNVRWDLSGASSGKHEITIAVDDGRGYVAMQTAEIEVVKYNCY